MSFAVEVLKRVGLAAVVAVVVVFGALAAGTVLTTPTGIQPGADHPEYATNELAPDRLESSGTPDASGDVGTVVIDRTRDNRFDREDVAPLVETITRAGGEVRFPEPNADMATTLSDADVLVVVDPGREYGQSDVEAIRQFLDAGGRLVIFGEPNRRAVQQEQVQAVLTTDRSHLTTLGSAFGISFGTQYLYDQQHNDGNFKNVVVGPPDDADHPLVEGVDDVALKTATSVSVADGTVVLRTAPTAKQGTSSQQGGIPVAAVTGNVLAIGDKSFLHPEFASVADNDAFVARIVEFMAGADGQGATDGNADLAGPVPTTHGSPNGALAWSSPDARTAGPAIPAAPETVPVESAGHLG